MPSARDKTKRLYPEFALVSPPLSGQPRHTHSFAPPGSGLQMDAQAYLDWRRSNYPFRPPRKHMFGDVDPEREIAEVTSHNFWGAVIPRHHGRMDRINERLCAQLLLFAMCYVEVAAVQIARRRQVPLATPQEIFAGLLDIGLAQGPVLGHDVWRYAKCVEHPLIGAAVLNAIYNSWGAPRNARAQPYPPPEDPFVTVRLPDEPARVAVPLPKQEDAAEHQHRQFPPDEGWPWRPGPRRKQTCAASLAPSPSRPRRAAGDDGAPSTPPLCPQAERAADDPAPAAVDPARFLEAARAAFEVGASYRNPHSEVLLVLAERLGEPTSTGLRDPFAPALHVLVQMLYGPSRAYYDEATRVFRRRYLALAAGPCRGLDDVEAALRRWRALVGLDKAASATLHDWCLARTAHPGPDSACALVAAASRTPLRPVRPSAWAGGSETFDAPALLLEAARAPGGGTAKSVAAAAETMWKGLFDRRLGFSQEALSPLAQHFLAALTRLAGEKGSIPLPTHKVWADELAEQAHLELNGVRAAFAGTDPARSPAHELFGRRVVLTDWRWSDLASAPLDLPWLSAPPRTGQHDGCAWQEVTLTDDLLPYLRRLHLYLDQMSLAAAATGH